MRKLLLFIAVILGAATAMAEPTAHELNELESLLVRGSGIPQLGERIDFYTNQLVGRPYLEGTLGEGDSGYFNKSPLWNLDEFDSASYINMIVALTKSQTIQQFEKNVINLRYKNGNPVFENRNYFVGVDWISHNTKRGTVVDITKQVASRVMIARATVDKPNWYRHLTSENLVGIPEQDKDDRLVELHNLSKTAKAETEMVAYIRKEAIVASPHILDRIPDGAMINIVRPNEDLSRTSGTHMNIFQQGFAVRRSDVLYFRLASHMEGRVIEVPLFEYVTKNMMPVRGIGGLNILKIR